MGQKQAKASSSPAPASKHSKSDVSRLLVEDTASLRSAAKQHGVLSELMLFESIEKRRAVYTSGKRCGDSEESLSEKMVKLGVAMQERHFESDATNKVAPQFECPAEKTELNAFDGLANALKSFLETKLSE